jgi:transposase-like protein
MNRCKQCAGKDLVKNGRVRAQQRYRCKSCGLNFVVGDKRVKEDTAIKRAFAVILYSPGKSSYGLIAKLFGVTRPAVQKWLKREADLLSMPEIPATIEEMEFHEMWHFIGSKKTNSGSSRPWTVLHGELSPGFSAVVMLQPSGGSTTKLST